MLYGASHPYGRRAKGTAASRSSASTRDAIWRRSTPGYVRPAALSLVIVGDVAAEQARRRCAAQRLEGWSGAAATAHRCAAARTLAPGAACVTIAMPGKSQTDIAYGFTTISRLDPRYYAYWMMNNILGQFGLGGRLADNIRERQGMAYYAFSSFDPTVGEGPLVVRAGVDPNNVERALEAIDARGRASSATDGPTRDRSRGDAQLPGRLDPADARDQPQHRRVPADAANSSASGSTTIAGCRRCFRP